MLSWAVAFLDDENPEMYKECVMVAPTLVPPVPPGFMGAARLGFLWPVVYSPRSSFLKGDFVLFALVVGRVVSRHIPYENVMIQREGLKLGGL